MPCQHNQVHRETACITTGQLPHYEWARQCLPPNTGEQQREQEHVVGEGWLILLPGNILISPRETKERRDNKVTEHGTYGSFNRETRRNNKKLNCALYVVA